MRFQDYLHVADIEAGRFAAAFAAVPADTPVPGCPGWTVGELGEHVVGLSRGVRWYLESGNPAPPAPEDVGAWFPASPGPVGDELRGVQEGIRTAGPDAVCWTVWPAVSPATFWARRHAHELTVHRVDVELAAGLPVSPIAAGFAADGVDELLTYLTRPGGPLAGCAGDRLDIEVGDNGVRWSAHLPGGTGECAISGPADQLYLALWNRGGDVVVTGDPAVLDSWRTTARWTFGS